MKLTDHIALAECIRVPASEVPASVIDNLRAVAELVEAVRVAMDLPAIVHSGYRTPAHNKRIGGSPTSDHLDGRAIDFHIADGGGQSWEENTFRAYHWLRKHRLPLIGQLILEDHRHATGKPSRLWVHVATPSPKHPGPASGNQLLVSYGPGQYVKFSDSIGGFA